MKLPVQGFRSVGPVVAGRTQIQRSFPREIAMLGGLIRRSQEKPGYMVQIWADVEEGQESHFYIKRSDEPRSHHYYHWDSLLLWHDTDIIHATTVVVKGNEDSHFCVHGNLVGSCSWCDLRDAGGLFPELKGE